MRNWFRRKSPIHHLPNTEETKVSSGNTETPAEPKYVGVAPPERWAQIEYAFTSGGIHYFKFNTEVNIPFQRAIAARDILTEELWQIDPNILKGWTESLINVVINNKLSAEKKLFEVGVLASRLKEQMELSFSLVRQLKLATVLYFDETENPLDYEYPYNKKKMEHWMKHNDVRSFFLNLPQYLYLPSGNELTQNFPTYLQAESQNITNLLKHIIISLPSDDSNNDLRKHYNSQVETLNMLNSWSKDQFTNTI